MTHNKKISIHPSLWAVGVVFFSMGGIGEFLWILFFITIHELSHIAAALFLGAKFQKITITPLGERAEIKEMERLDRYQRFFILFMGPLMSLVLGLLFYTIAPYLKEGLFFSQVNLCIAFFNFLPLIPLDGGAMCLLFLEDRFGTVNTAKFLLRLSRGFSVFLILAGLVQLILYPFNCSLFFMGIYFSKVNKKEEAKIVASYYAKVHKIWEGKLYHKCNVREILVTGEESMDSLFRGFSGNYFYQVCLIKGDRVIKRNQNDMMTAVLKKGFQVKVKEIFEKGRKEDCQDISF